jgi:hypothetical protein
MSASVAFRLKIGDDHEIGFYSKALADGKGEPDIPNPDWFLVSYG